MWKNLFKVKKFQFVIFKPLNYCFEEIIGFDIKASFASRPVSRLIRWYNKTRWYNNRILNFEKRLFTPTGLFIDWKLQTDILETKVASILLPLCRFSATEYLHHASELPNWDKSDRIFNQIILVTSKAEEKIQKLYFHYSGNFDENTKRPHERDPPRIRRVIKKYISKLFELTAWHLEVPTSH